MVCEEKCNTNYFDDFRLIIAFTLSDSKTPYDECWCRKMMFCNAFLLIKFFRQQPLYYNVRICKFLKTFSRIVMYNSFYILFFLTLHIGSIIRNNNNCVK